MYTSKTLLGAIAEAETYIKDNIDPGVDPSRLYFTVTEQQSSYWEVGDRDFIVTFYLSDEGESGSTHMGHFAVTYDALDLQYSAVRKLGSALV